MTKSLEKLSPDGKILLAHIKDEFSKLSDQIFDQLEARCIKIVEDKCQEIEGLHTEIKSLNTRLAKFQDDLDTANQYSRKDMIILSGPAVTPVPENDGNADPSAESACSKHVRKLIKEHLKIDVSPLDISTTHPLRPQNRAQAETPKRNIVVKFVRRDLKQAIIRRSKIEKKPKLFCNESLTGLRSSMFRALRNMKADSTTQVKGCTTIDGKVFAFTKSPDPNARDIKHYIENMSSLREFCRKFVKKPLDDFLANFRS